MGAGERAIFDELHPRRGVAHAEAAVGGGDDDMGPVPRGGVRGCTVADGRAVMDRRRGERRGRSARRQHREEDGAAHQPTAARSEGSSGFQPATPS